MIKNQGYISIFRQPGQGKARLRPSSTSFPIARQPNTANAQAEGTEKHTIFILTLIKKKKSIRVFMILVDFLLDKI